MKNYRSLLRLIVVLGISLGILGMVGLAFASDSGSAGDGSQSKTIEGSLAENYIGVDYLYWSDSNVEDDKGKFSVSTTRVALGYSHFFLNYQRSFYSWTDKQRLPFGNGVDDPWDHLQSVALGMRFNGAIGQDWRYLASVAATSSFEDDSGPLGVNGIFSFSKSLTDNVRLNFGLTADYHIVETIVLPVLSVSYNDVGRSGAQKQGFSASIGIPDTSLTYHFNSTVAARLALGYDRRIYKLRDDSPVAREGYVKDRTANAGLYLDLNPVENLSISVGILHSFAHELEFYDRNENKLNDYNVDGSLGGSVRVLYTF